MRKKINDANRVTLTLATKVTADEYDLIKQAAEILQRTASNYTRFIMVEAARNEVKKANLQK